MSKWSAGLPRVTPPWIEPWLGRAGLHRVTPRTAERGLSRNWLHRLQPAPAAARCKGAGHANVPKEQASDSGDRSHPHRTDLGGRSLRCRCTRTQDRNRVIWYRLPLRDDLSIDAAPDDTQYHLSPNIGRGGGVIHRLSTTPHELELSDV